jgi:hypothetical protein
LFNVQALQALGINPIEARERGYPMKEQPAMAEEEASPQLRHARFVPWASRGLRSAFYAANPE